MNTVERKRLEKLIQFLDNLLPERFNFGDVVSHLDRNSCNSVCCAIGWTPAIFPRMVHWAGVSVYYVALGKPRAGKPYERPFETYVDVAVKLFGLPYKPARWLFTPNLQDLLSKDLPICSQRASPQEVAAMLRKFLKLVDSKKIILSWYS